jgi:hypothetical protein
VLKLLYTCIFNGFSTAFQRLQVSKLFEKPTGPTGIMAGTFVTALERCTFVPTAQYSAFMQQLRLQQADAAVHAAINGTAAASLTDTSSNNDHSSNSSSSSSSSTSSTVTSEDNVTDTSNNTSSSSSSSEEVEQDFTQPFVLQWYKDAYGLEDPLGAMLNKLTLINRTPTTEFVQREHSLTTLAVAGNVPLWRVTSFNLLGSSSHCTVLMLCATLERGFV